MRTGCLLPSWGFNPSNSGHKIGGKELYLLLNHLACPSPSFVFYLKDCFSSARACPVGWTACLANDPQGPLCFYLLSAVYHHTLLFNRDSGGLNLALRVECQVLWPHQYLLLTLASMSPHLSFFSTPDTTAHPYTSTSPSRLGCTAGVYVGPSLMNDKDPG